MRARARTPMLAVLISLGWWVGCSAGPERAADLRVDAVAAIERGDLPAARQALRELERHGDDTPEARLDRAQLLLRAGEAPQAVWLLEAAIERFPEHHALRTQLARTALVVGNAVLARQVLRQLPPGTPEHLEGRMLAAQAELELGDLEAALQLFADAAAEYPDRPEIAMAEIGTLMNEGRDDEAAAALARAIAAAPSPQAIRTFELLAAQIELVKGDRDAAIAILERTAERHPDDGYVLQTLVRALVLAGREEEALARVEDELARRPDEPGLMAILAQVRLHRGELDAAESLIRAFADRTDSPSALELLARFHARRGEPARAERTFADAVARFPDAPMLRLHLAESLIGKGDLDAARAQRDAFVGRAGEGDPHGAYLDARIALAEGDAAAAAAILGALVSRLDRSYTQFWLGRALERRGDVEGAERRFGLALLRDPHHTASASALVRLAAARGDWKAVAGISLALVERDPTAAAYPTAVTALVRSGQVGRADHVSQRALALFPERADVVVARSLALRALARHDEALALLSEAEGRLGASPALSEERAFVLAARGDLAGGIEALRAALERSPERASLHAALAALELGRGNAPVGIAAVDRALELDPDEPTPLALRANFYASRGALEEAKQDCERFLDKRPHDAGVLFMLGVVSEAMGENDAAMAHYQRAAELDPQAYAPRNNLAVLLAAEGELGDAMAVAQEAYALAGDDANVIDTLGWLYLQAGLTDRAVALLERAHRADPRQPAPQFHLALAYRETGRPDDARRLLVELKARVEPGSLVADQADAALRTLQ